MGRCGAVKVKARRIAQLLARSLGNHCPRPWASMPAACSPIAHAMGIAGRTGDGKTKSKWQKWCNIPAPLVQHSCAFGAAFLHFWCNVEIPSSFDGNGADVLYLFLFYSVTLQILYKEGRMNLFLFCGNRLFTNFPVRNSSGLAVKADTYLHEILAGSFIRYHVLSERRGFR